MIQGFGKLSKDQFQNTKDAIAWITVLIAGADGEIDAEETAWAEKVTKIRSYNNPNELTPFYDQVGHEFTDKLQALVAAVPKDVKEREVFLSNKLAQLNDVLPLLEDNLGYQLRKEYISFAKHVAKASGGFLGFLSVSAAESKLVDLDMIKPVSFIGEEEE